MRWMLPTQPPTHSANRLTTAPPNPAVLPVTASQPNCQTTQLPNCPTAQLSITAHPIQELRQPSLVRPSSKQHHAPGTVRQVLRAHLRKGGLKVGGIGVTGRRVRGQAGCVSSTTHWEQRERSYGLIPRNWAW